MKIINLFLVATTTLLAACGDSETNSNNGSATMTIEKPQQIPITPPESEEDKPLAPGTYVKISTYYGDMYITLHDATPKHKENFLKLVEEGFYDSTTFHRVIDGFMIQGGDPNSKDDNPDNDGMGGTGTLIPAEFVDSLKHIRGAVAAARTGGPSNPEKESSGCQFYIVENHNGRHDLDGEYTVFGQVAKGLNVPDKICMQEIGPRDRPVKNIYIKAEIVEIGENDTIDNMKATDEETGEFVEEEIIETTEE